MTSVVIVAAGRGTRMGPGIDKLFLEVAGAPVVAHTWRRFDSTASIDAVVLVVRDGLQEAFHDLARTLGVRKPYKLVTGGAERQDSVWNGLCAVDPATRLVAIQDGARPCTAVATIEACLAAADRTGAAVAAQRAVDTMKESDGGTRIARHLDRSRLWAVQTPQCFQVEVIRRALGAVQSQKLPVTDDTAACEAIGQPVELVESPLPNPKVTSPSDLPIVEFLLKNS
jgi:2-C-methyl-D-erythritol 4-phosphate cytidylyltransferase